MTPPATVIGDARNVQALDALESANRNRLGKAAAKRALRNGSLTLAEVAASRPEPLRPMPLFSLLLELPGLGHSRLVKINQRAVTDRINLAVNLGGASPDMLDWLVTAVTGQLDFNTPDALTGAAAADGWRSVAQALDTLVLEHERSVLDESQPVERWAWADERLHRARAVVMGHAPAREEPPA